MGVASMATSPSRPWTTTSPVVRTNVVGTFIGWGKIVRGELGMRTEFARPESVIDMGLDEMGKQKACPPDSLKAVADHYKILYLPREVATDLQFGLIPFSEDMLEEKHEGMND